jgi:hypothetical protein
MSGLAYSGVPDLAEVTIPSSAPNSGKIESHLEFSEQSNRFAGSKA